MASKGPAGQSTQPFSCARYGATLHVDSVQKFGPSLSILQLDKDGRAALSLRGDRSFLTLLW
jgi:hypothetical protein